MTPVIVFWTTYFAGWTISAYFVERALVRRMPDERLANLITAYTVSMAWPFLALWWVVGKGLGGG